jgi:hypothetical protein
MVVDFPEPLGPSRPKICPAGTSKEMERTASTRGRRQKSRKVLERCSAWMAFMRERGHQAISRRWKERAPAARTAADQAAA